MGLPISWAWFVPRRLLGCSRRGCIKQSYSAEACVHSPSLRHAVVPTACRIRPSRQVRVAAWRAVIELRAKTWNSEVISSRPAIAFGVFAVPGGPFSGRVASRPVTHSDSVAFSVFSVGGEQAGEGERGFCGGDEG